MRLYFSDGAHQLAAFPRVVAHGLLNVNVLAGLAAPNGLQRVPVVGRGDGDRVDGLVFQKFAQVDEGGGLLDPHFFHLVHAAVHDVLIHVADGGDFHVRHLGILLDVRPSLSVQSDDGNAHAVVRPENPLRFGKEANPSESRQTGPGSSGRLDEIPAIDFRIVRHGKHSSQSLRGDYTFVASGIFSIFGVSNWTTPMARGCMTPAMINSGRYE